MAPKSKLCPIPEGWTWETEVRKNGSKVLFYYCAETDQRFNTYVGLKRYVRYAKRKRFSIYDQMCKPVKKKRSLEKVSKDTNTTEWEKKFAMSTRSTQRSPSLTLNSPTVELSFLAETFTISSTAEVTFRS